MGTFRMYTDGEGKARWETIGLDQVPSWAKGLDATRIIIRARAVGAEAGWHPAPQRQFVIILSGHLEIGFEDGSKKIFGPGDARLMEDLTGKGHTTATFGSEPCVAAYITLKDQIVAS